MKIVPASMMLAVLTTTGALAGVDAMKNFQEPESGKAAVMSFGGEGGREFMLDGKPFQIRSAEIHPQRVPREYWQHRIRTAKAMGLNTIAFYTFWNLLEKEEGSWDFSGNNDIAAFIDLCMEEGMWVLFRPGPYVCGEWDLGGLPTYLIKDDVTPLRNTKNPQFMEAQTRYLEKMAEIAAPRLSRNGGPILMVQLENEYGSYKSPHDELAYIEWLKDFWTKKGAGPFYVSEGSSMHHLRFVPKGVAVGLDPADRASDMRNALRIAPGVPVFSSETYPGWLRHWGEGNWTPTRETLDAVRWYMRDGVSFNIFVYHGGTNFGLTAGANSNEKGGNFQPDLTSYDYGSPVGEHGNLTREYFEYRDIILGALPELKEKAPAVPETPATMEIPAFTPQAQAPLCMLSMKKVKEGMDTPCTLESIGQNQGIAVYSAPVPAGEAAPLTCQAHDFAQVYVGDTYVGNINRMKGQTGIMLPKRDKDETLRIVVDTFGHVNFCSYMEKDRKGIIGRVTLGNRTLNQWELRVNPLTEVPQVVPGKPHGAALGGLFKAEVELQEVADTFLDMAAWPKGYVWVNGHLLGRYWNIGPQERLYCPASFLKQGKNEIVVLDFFADVANPPSISGKHERNMEVKKETKSLNNQWD